MMTCIVIYKLIDVKLKDIQTYDVHHGHVRASVRDLKRKRHYFHIVKTYGHRDAHLSSKRSYMNAHFG
jgi:hypothetical protein